MSIKNEEENSATGGGICQYDGCGKEFETKRRWARKYCSDSCRTLASRYRKNGLAGSKVANPRSKGINDLYSLVLQQQQELIGLLMGGLQSVAGIGGKADAQGYVLSDIREDVADLKTEVGNAKVKNDLAFKMIDARLDLLQKSMIAILEAIGDVRSKQANQDWVVILSSVIGPKVGDFLEKLILGDGKSTDKEIMKALTEMKNLLGTGQNRDLKK